MLFIPSRDIDDNILIAYEFLILFKKLNKREYMAINKILKKLMINWNVILFENESWIRIFIPDGLLNYAMHN